MTKTWFISGAASGLGLEMTQQLLARGDAVAGTSRRDGALANLEEKYRETLLVLKLELTDVKSIRAAVDAAFEELGTIDVVVSNAGYGLVGAAEELSDAQIDQQIATNLVGCIQLIRAALPHMRTQGGGRIVQISSEGGQIAYPNFSLYHASKWGIEGFIEAVCQEVAPFGIDFVIAEPGPTATKFREGLVHAESMAVYDDTPAGQIRRLIQTGAFVLKGDAARTAAAIISTADREKPELRLALGSAAYQSISKALAARLSSIEGQHDVAFAADRPDV
ncbi:SDR family oxidoreductase [Acidocella aminolytica]|uniref:Oxidoreductase/short-chain dehydrogenase/reductase SDR n=1 Tax=Acidocella aminolytica 101 = DSM 11237 TaxID=1120923 RepID=A0A0D6PB38_9PROT|nr:SDR family oxidoreductase [Acidocella aminolytica]GAN78975.1 oxidoreductase/short-chain dehydrogenase/reductase SDR [Acidocella aminolytica 101 = DSM 11237]GBQ34661.1 dehydrogenase [Acidocella aminolytica 101 = DSM 11237]SHF10785.1 Short-chain dehydrogenase [Acidocella aminolytica 101 = DSM 11237]